MLHFNCSMSWTKQVFAKRNRANPTEETYPRVKEKKRKKKKRLLCTWNYCSDARREQCISQNLHVTNHQSSTSQSTGFPTAARRNKNTPRHTLLSYSITCSAVPKLTNYTNCCSTLNQNNNKKGTKRTLNLQTRYYIQENNASLSISTNDEHTRWKRLI